jgi:hypothetical protein
MKPKKKLVRYVANIEVRYPSYPNEKDNARNAKQLRKDIKDLLETYSYLTVDGCMGPVGSDYEAFAPDIRCAIREIPFIWKNVAAKLPQSF